METKESLLKAIDVHIDSFHPGKTEKERRVLCQNAKKIVEEEWGRMDLDATDGNHLTKIVRAVLEELKVTNFSNEYWLSPIVNVFLDHAEAEAGAGGHVSVVCKETFFHGEKRKIPLAGSSVFDFGKINIPVHPVPSFKTDEHVLIGDEIMIRDVDVVVPVGKKNKLQVYAFGDGGKPKKIDGALLTLGEIVALAGDYYGTPNPISDEKDSTSRQSRFIAHYNTLAQKDIMKQKEKILSGRSTWDELLALLGENYRGLLVNNFDHFAHDSDSLTAYQAGHEQALKMAHIAHELNKKGTPEAKAEAKAYLSLAYTMNAFAGHFLSDSAAGGHVWTPRRVLASKFGQYEGGVLANAEHNEDGDHGVFCTIIDEHGKPAVEKLYGDGKYAQDSVVAKDFIKEMMQISTDAIHAKYMGEHYDKKITMPTPIPKGTKVLNPDGTVKGYQHYPLFSPDGLIRKEHEPSSAGYKEYEPLEGWAWFRHSIYLAKLVGGGFVGVAPTVRHESEAPAPGSVPHPSLVVS